MLQFQQWRSCWLHNHGDLPVPYLFWDKVCRDNFYHGTITFGQGVKVGLLITLIAAVMYALAWEVCYNTVATDFVDKFVEHYISEAKTTAGSPAEVEAVVAEMASFQEWYRNPFLRSVATLTEILPVGSS